MVTLTWKSENIANYFYLLSVITYYRFYVAFGLKNKNKRE